MQKDQKMITDLSQTLKKGTLLVIETGEYSDRCTSDPVRLLKTATKEKLAEDFKKEWKPTEFSWNDVPDPGDFLSWLVSSGRAEAVDDVHTWHVGSYGRFEP
jgi:hypothetical protein